jgi:phosphoribosylformylglycinamidine cyclo-ligase
MKATYASAGVNIDLKSKVISKIGQYARSATRPEVLSGVGFFGGLFEMKGYKKPVIVSSVDGVGTKLKIASALKKFDTVGKDIVAHCVNDIITSGAEPVFFLDYIAVSKIVPKQLEAIGKGLAEACKDVGMALIGGETAEMPGIYHGTDFDLVGCIVGVVEKDAIKLESGIVPGDAVICLPSNGLHTNAYSLARQLFGETPKELNKKYPELGRSVGDALMETHICYYNQVKPVMKDIKGLAHVTGGGPVGNIPRSLPKGLAVNLDSSKWSVPPIFTLMQKKGDIEKKELYRVFNMGIGMAVICAPEKVKKLLKVLPGSTAIGEVVKQKGEARVIIDGDGYRQDKVA